MHKSIGIVHSNTLSTRLREERERLGWAQQEAASAAGVRREMWAKYEAGSEPGAKALAGMAAAGVDVLYVLSGHRSNYAAPHTLAPKEQIILDAYRSGTPEQQDFILKAALGFGGTEGVVATKSSQVFHGNVGQSVKGRRVVQKGMKLSVRDKSEK